MGLYRADSLRLSKDAQRVGHLFAPGDRVRSEWRDRERHHKTGGHCMILVSGRSQLPHTLARTWLGSGRGTPGDERMTGWTPRSRIVTHGHGSTARWGVRVDAAGQRLRWCVTFSCSDHRSARVRGSRTVAAVQRSKPCPGRQRRQRGGCSRYGGDATAAPSCLLAFAVSTTSLGASVSQRQAVAQTR